MEQTCHIGPGSRSEYTGCPRINDHPVYRTIRQGDRDMGHTTALIPKKTFPNYEISTECEPASLRLLLHLITDCFKGMISFCWLTTNR